MRVAVVEIGSRAVRLLIADVAGGRVEPIRASSRSVALSKILGASEVEMTQVLRQLKVVVAGLREEASRNRVDVFKAFGTAALRRLKRAVPKEVEALDESLVVLNPEEEAECSFVAAVTDPGVEATRNGPYVVVDMGAGSIEVVSGRLRDGSPIVKENVSCLLGSERISGELVAAAYDLKKYDVWLDGELAKEDIFKRVIGADTVLLGSLPTKVAWLHVRPSERDIYNPKLVGGARLDRDKMRALAEEILRRRLQSANDARRFVDPRNNDDAELNLVVSGLILLEKILIIQQRKNCRVSSRGTRFGFAYKLSVPTS